MARLGIVLLLLVGVIVVATLQLAPADHLCVAYSVENPILPVGDDPCSPEGPPFTGSPIWPGACVPIEEAGVRVCATVHTHLP